MHAKSLPAANPLDAPAAFRHPVRVYWEDTDAGGVVFYANYLRFFERARTEWLRGLGFSQQQMLLDEGVMFVVTDTALRYRRPARLDDRLDITVRLLHCGRASLHIAQQALRGVDLLVEGDIRIGCVTAGNGDEFRACRIPAAILHTLS